MLKYFKGQLSARIAYPLAEKLEKRTISLKFSEISAYYQRPFVERKKIMHARLADVVEFAGTKVPYYRDLLQSIHFSYAKLRKDLGYLNEIPYLTKEIIREQGPKLLSQPLADVRHHLRKTGGSTGSSCMIYYDQEALDYSAAITLYARHAVGKLKHLSELHFACRFPEKPRLRDQVRENMKCFAMNRSNIFFAALDDAALADIWQTLQKRQPYLVHAHPSTIYALACYIEKKYGQAKAFTLFESSGELLEPYMREKISKALMCQVIDRYGLAELGVIAYELPAEKKELSVLDSEGFMETDAEEIVFTGLRNRLLPLLRYRTGDMGVIKETANGWKLAQLVGRIHDIILLDGVNYATHYVQDILDHRVGGIQEFQIDLRHTPPKLLLVPEASAKLEDIRARIKTYLHAGLEVCFVSHNDLIRVGHRAKFRHVVTA